MLHFVITPFGQATRGRTQEVENQTSENRIEEILAMICAKFFPHCWIQFQEILISLSQSELLVFRFNVGR